jgi:hypothetical protein
MRICVDVPINGPGIPPGDPDLAIWAEQGEQSLQDIVYPSARMRGPSFHCPQLGHLGPFCEKLWQFRQ